MKSYQDFTFSTRIRYGTPSDKQRDNNGNAWQVEKPECDSIEFYEVLPRPRFFHLSAWCDAKGQPKERKRKIIDMQRNLSMFLLRSMNSFQDLTFPTRIQDGIPMDNQRDNPLANNVCLGIHCETMYVWESLWKQCMFGNPWGNNVCLGIPEETMHGWESLGKQCAFVNPLVNNVCLEIPWDTMYVWESLGKQCMFGNPWGNNICLGILGETLYVWESLMKQCRFENPLGNPVCLGIPNETMYVWESLRNNVCLGIPRATMYVWESIGEQCVSLWSNACLWNPGEASYVCKTLGEQCMFGNPWGNNVCLGIP